MGLFIESHLEPRSQQVYAKAVETFGEDAQLAILMEELCELGVAASHIRRHRNDNRREYMVEFLEELADVTIMLEQAKMIACAHGVTLDSFNAFVDAKTNRLQELINKHTQEKPND